MMIMERGYARVSIDGQSLEAQLEALKAADCKKIYSEKVSGASCRDRKALAKLLREANPGDTVVVTRLDRLARSTRSNETACPSIWPIPAISLPRQSSDHVASFNSGAIFF